MSILKIAIITSIMASTAALPTLAWANGHSTETPATANAPTSTTAGTARLTVEFTGLKELSGAIMGVVVNSEDAYNEKAKPVRMMMIKADKASVSELLEGLAPGRYAIKVFHDVDGDMKMSVNPYGMPIEPFAFSNDAKGNMGPATWAAANFEVKSGDNTHRITID